MESCDPGSDLFKHVWTFATNVTQLFVLDIRVDITRTWTRRFWFIAAQMYVVNCRVRNTYVHKSVWLLRTLTLLIWLSIKACHIKSIRVQFKLIQTVLCLLLPKISRRTVERYAYIDIKELWRQYQWGVMCFHRMHVEPFTKAFLSLPTRMY